MQSNHPILHLRHPTPEIFAWNRLLRLHPNPVSLYPRLLRHGTRPDSYTFPLILSSLSLVPAVLPQLHSHILVSGHSHHPHVLSSLLSAYSSLPSDLLLFHSAPLPLDDLPTANSLLSALLRAGHLLPALHLFDEMPRRNVVSWSALIDGHAKHDHPHAALSLFRSMLADVRAPAPNQFTLSAVLSACARLGALHHGILAHSFVARLGLPVTTVLATSLVDMYAKCGRIDAARRVFHELPPENRDAAAWTAMISGLAVHGLAGEALAAFRGMVRCPVSTPNSATFVAVLQACVHGGLVREGELQFAGMSRDFGVAPAIEHFGCMVDLYARAGLLDRAWSTVRSMPMRPDAVIWGALLGGSRTHGDLVSGEAAIGALIEMEPGNAGACALLSNVYAEMGRWDEVSVIRAHVERFGAKKTPGCSSVEIDGELHEFFAGDFSVPEAEGLHNMVEEMMARLWMAGDVGKTAGEVLLDLGGEEEGMDWRWI
ncbi:Pentatricopeptide repeat-containing protein [Platanthera guangdongensis]|uniref:Pentatricopeptide repeat-containing protein n=1 Tax=Platanthera guangdongensis TaxID=2320717 RepID=A0ABR2MAK3_9ASPA